MARACISSSRSACAPIYEGIYDYNEGWREAVITQIGAKDKITGRAFLDCRPVYPPEPRPDDLFAKVAFSNARNNYSYIVRIPHLPAPRAGDHVYVKMDDCSQPVAMQGRRR